MGRPLNKKYIGNRNIGEARPSDDGIGGSKLASITVTAAGTYNASHATALTTTFPAPLIANGVTAVSYTHLTLPTIYSV